MAPSTIAGDGTPLGIEILGVNKEATLCQRVRLCRPPGGVAADDEHNLPVAGRLVSAAVAGVDPAMMGIGMVPASRKALEDAGLSVADLDLVEANEAFAAVAVAVQRELDVPDEKMNPLGGAVALGHPIGATGAVLLVKILHELKRRDARYGLVTLCIGGGMGIAAVLERV
jgi:acetyl-CoA C-acetyltransferase